MAFDTRTTLNYGNKNTEIYSLEKLSKAEGVKDLSRLPYCLKVLLENVLRYEDGTTVTKEDILGLANWDPKAKPSNEIAFRPARVLLQDFTGVPAVVDLAAMRDAMAEMGGDPKKINPLQPADLVIDHSVQIDKFGSPGAFLENIAKEYGRNSERYSFLRWGQSAFKNFRVVPPDTGIVHQVNLEYLASCVFLNEDTGVAYPDSLVGTDSHTTMINGLGVLGWGVGGIEAEAAMLGQPITLLIPQVVGFKLKGKLKTGITATDLVLQVVQMLREKGVVGKFVEFYGEGLNALTLADRATLANMAPEYGATMGFFPVDDETLRYLEFSGRKKEAELVEAYCKHQGMYYSSKESSPDYSDTLELDLSEVEPSISGPKRPQDRILLKNSKSAWSKALQDLSGGAAKSEGISTTRSGKTFDMNHGDVVIAAITSCTNTSNPSVMVGAGLLAKKAVEKGLTTKPWVKTSLAPGSKVVTEYLKKANLIEPLEKLGFHIAAYGCTTCIGNSGPLPDEISESVKNGDLVVTSVLSGNRNFEGRINPLVKANYLASPPLVVAYALAGKMDFDWNTDKFKTSDGKEVSLEEIWPTADEINETINSSLESSQFDSQYGAVFEGSQEWQDLDFPRGERYLWDDDSTYVKQPPFFNNLSKEPKPVKDIVDAHCLVLLGDSVTTDHISPAGSIAEDSPAGKYLKGLGVNSSEFNSYGSRRGNHEVMMRGTFANIRLRNELAPDTEGSWTRKLPEGNLTSIYDAAMEYKKNSTPLVIIAGKEYGTGSSRDWAAKGTALLGAKAVIAESYERIHRSNLVGMGVLPLQFIDGQSRASLNLNGEEIYSISGIEGGIEPGKILTVTAKTKDGESTSFDVVCRIDTLMEYRYYENGGILQYVLRSLLAGA